MEYFFPVIFIRINLVGVTLQVMLLSFDGIIWDGKINCFRWEKNSEEETRSYLNLAERVIELWVEWNFKAIKRLKKGKTL